MLSQLKVNLQKDYSAAKLNITQENAGEAIKNIVALLNELHFAYKSCPKDFQESQVKQFMFKWSNVVLVLREKGITKEVVDVFAIDKSIQPPLKEKQQLAEKKVAKNAEFNDSLDEISSQGWCAKIFGDNKKSVVKIKVKYPTARGTQGNAGTGFIISKGYLLTNHHVIVSTLDEKRATIHMVFGDDDRLYPIKLVASDHKKDVALCSFDCNQVKNFKAIKFIDDYSRLVQGADIVIIGNTLAKGLAPFSGTVRYTQDDRGNLVNTAESNNGDSGGPVFNNKGECVGIHKSRTKSIVCVDASAFSNATPTIEIRRLISRWQREYKIKIL